MILHAIQLAGIGMIALYFITRGAAIHFSHGGDWQSPLTGAALVVTLPTRLIGNALWPILTVRP